MIVWKALLKNKTEIYNDFYKNKDKVEIIYIIKKRYIYEDPDDSTKELNFPFIKRAIKGKKLVFKRVEQETRKFNVSAINNIVIQEARMRNVYTGRDVKVGIKLTLDKGYIYFDDENNTEVNGAVNES